MKFLKYLFFILSIYGFSQNNDKIHSNPDKQAEYPGGVKKLKEEISRIVYYPKEAQERNIQGKVILHLIVEKDGSISDINIYKDIGRGCGAEAVKALNSLQTKWEPATIKEKPVRSIFTLSVLFYNK